MKANIFFCLTLFLLVPTFKGTAQQKITDFEVGMTKPTEVQMASDNKGNLAFILQSNKQYEAAFLNSSYAVTNKVIIEKLKTDKNQKILGSVLSDEAFYVYTFNKKLKAISCLEIPKTNGSSKTFTVKILNVHDELLRSFEMDGKFYILIVPKNSNQLKVWKIKGAELTEIQYAIEMPTFYSELSRNNDALNVEAESAVGIEDIRYDLENNIKSTYPSKKLYHHDGKIYLTFDDPNLTHLLVLDAESKTMEYRKLNFSLDKGNNSHDKQGNSFMYKNRFFRSTMSPEQMNITILDLDSMHLINTYNLYPDFDIQILNGPIIQESSGGAFGGDEKIVKNSNQYFKKVLRGNLAIAANLVDSSRFELEVGSYEMYSGSNSGMGGPMISFGMGTGMGMGGYGMGMPGMGMGMPGMGMRIPYGGGGSMGGGYPYNGFPGYYNGQPSSKIRITYFQSLLNSTNFAHVDGNVPPKMKDKINDFETNVFRNNIPDVLRVAPYKNNLLLGYYQKNTKRINLIEFKRQ